ncbi:DUF1161 domain-containing protein [Ideonella sp. A 288]|uniref:DUF1161 domain-containing protein n=1 Tax=Ideonella sp. A 288 TaxID=1962181 RepID=UPI000B4B06CE|nr:DUF1161 domain-containing protein [Ideonella sp. A 288]
MTNSSPLHERRPSTRRWLLLCTLAAAGPAGAASNCEAIRDQIGAKVRASGVQQFALAIVDAQAKVAGRVVGTCDMGSRKIVYSTDAAAGGRAAVARPRDEPLLTECKDGRVSVGGDCRK